MRNGISFREAIGLIDMRRTAAQVKLAIAGDATTPKSRFGTSSLKIFTPSLSVRTWLGAARADKKLPIMNLVNRTPTPVRDGWSVRVTHVQDFRGGGLTYDSHNGTDFVAPPGSRIVAAAPGRVRALRREFQRGGLKMYIDHGRGLVTTYNHLARALVAVGDEVGRGDVIAFSGYSGIDAVVGFPWVAPHLHFNVWHNGVAADPFARDGEVSLWRAHNDPRPHSGAREVLAQEPHFAAADVDAVRADYLADASAIDAERDVDRRAVELLIESVTYPTRFRGDERGRLLYPAPFPREPRLDLPFHADEFDGVVFLDR